MEGALVSSLIAQRERELLFGGDGAGGGIVAGRFERQSAAAEPVVLRHAIEIGAALRNIEGWR